MITLLNGLEKNYGKWATRCRLMTARVALSMPFGLIGSMEVFGEAVVITGKIMELGGNYLFMTACNKKW